jgi:hypothetical protein
MNATNVNGVYPQNTWHVFRSQGHLEPWNYACLEIEAISPKLLAFGKPRREIGLLANS